jgi:hypothetical protein
MRKTLLLLSLAALTGYTNAQTIVSTTPENKKAIVEEFTGTGCPNCPGGHTTAAGILTANPGTVFVIANHPTNSSYTTSDIMANAFPNAFYTNPFISPSNRYMPCAMINRRVWGAVERIQGTANWASDVSTIKTESSPLNVGVSSSYNTSTKMLSVNVEVYFTADVTDAVTLFTMITEDGIIADQSGGTSPYTHNHVFRAALPTPSPAQWGEAIAAPTAQSSFKTYTYTFDNSTSNFVMTACEIVAFVRDATTEEILSGNGAPVGSSTGIATTPALTDHFSVYPNPVSETATLHLNLAKPSPVTYLISDPLGNKAASGNLGMLSAGSHQVNINTGMLSKGIYFISISNGVKTNTIKVVKL